jgi:hypothetical protein
MIRKVALTLFATLSLVGAAAGPAAASSQDPCVELLGWSSCAPRP